MSAPKEQSARLDLGHLPEGKERGAPALAGAGECVSTNRAEALEVELTVERVPREAHGIMYDNSPPRAQTRKVELFVPHGGGPWPFLDLLLRVNVPVPVPVHESRP